MKDLKDVIIENLGQVNESSFRCDGKIQKHEESSTEVLPISNVRADQLYVMYDDNAGEIDIISTSDIEGYTQWAGETEEVSAKLAKLKPGEVYKDSWGYITRLK